MCIEQKYPHMCLIINIIIFINLNISSSRGKAIQAEMDEYMAQNVWTKIFLKEEKVRDGRRIDGQITCNDRDVICFKKKSRRKLYTCKGEREEIAVLYLLDSFLYIKGLYWFLVRFPHYPRFRSIQNHIAYKGFYETFPDLDTNV